MHLTSTGLKRVAQLTLPEKSKKGSKLAKERNSTRF
jgi:hypothetical protein